MSQSCWQASTLLQHQVLLSGSSFFFLEIVYDLPHNELVEYLGHKAYSEWKGYQ